MTKEPSLAERSFAIGTLVGRALDEDGYVLVDADLLARAIWENEGYTSPPPIYVVGQATRIIDIIRELLRERQQ